MKMLLFIAVTIFSFNASAEFIREMPPNTEFIFAKKIPLNLHQNGLLVANRQCRLTFGREVLGLSHIGRGTILYVKNVEFKDAEEGQNPISGHTFRTIPIIKVKFKRTVAEIICQGEGVQDLHSHEFESDGVFKIISPDITDPFIFVKN